MICWSNKFIERKEKTHTHTNKWEKETLRLEDRPQNIPSHDAGLGNEFWDMTPKVRAKEEKNRQMGLREN